MATVDPFSVRSNSRLIEKTCFRTSITWKILRVQERAGKGQNRPIVSPTFKFGDESLELAVYSPKRRRGESLLIDYVELRCEDKSPDSAFSIYISRCTFSGETGNILKEITDEIRLSCITTFESTVYITAFFYLKDITSLTVSLDMFSEESKKRVFLDIFKEEKEEIPLDCYSKLSSDFGALYENRQLSDVTLKLGDVEFPAHKSVLSARSKVFAAMFEHDMVENRQSTVDLVQVEAGTVHDMLRYVYCGKVRGLSSSEALDLYVAADRYDLQELKDICREVVVRGISLSNVFDVAVIADMHSDEVIIGKLKSFISRNGAAIINTEEWKAMPTKNPVLGMKLFELLFRGENCSLKRKAITLKS